MYLLSKQRLFHISAQRSVESLLESNGEAAFNVVPMQYKSTSFYLRQHGPEARLYLGGRLSPMIKHGAQQLTF